MSWSRGYSSGFLTSLKEAFQIRMVDELTLLLPNLRTLIPPVLHPPCPESLAQEFCLNHPSTLPLPNQKAVDPNHCRCLQIEARLLIQLVHHLGRAARFLNAVLFHPKIQLNPIETHSVRIVTEQLQVEPLAKLQVGIQQGLSLKAGHQQGTLVHHNCHIAYRVQVGRGQADSKQALKSSLLQSWMSSRRNYLRVKGVVCWVWHNRWSCGSHSSLWENCLGWRVAGMRMTDPTF